MKTLNKYQIKAQADRLARIARGELRQIADRAIANARRDLAVGSHTIDASDMTASANPITRHLGEQMDGYSVDSAISAKVELDSARREIGKLGLVDGRYVAEARVELERIEAVIAELNLNAEEAE